MHRPRIRRTTLRRIIAGATLAAVALTGAVATTARRPEPASSRADRGPDVGGARRATTTTTEEAASGHDVPDADGDFVVDGEGGGLSGHDLVSDVASNRTPASPVDLDPVEPFAPPTETPDDPETVDVLAGPTGGPSQWLVGNAQGCAARCIKSALLHRQLRRTDVRFTIETDRWARFVAEMSTQPPVYDEDGTPSLPSAQRVFTTVGRKAWETTFEGLAPDTVHHFLVRATDMGGRSQYATTSFRTVDPVGVAGDLVATPAGCAYQCISTGSATGIAHDRAALHVETSTPAELTVSVSTQEPGWIGGSPVLPTQVPVFVPTGLTTAWDLGVTGLAPETTYHVVVRATDAEGRHSSRIGRFTTADAPPVTVEATVRQVTVVSDGDPGAMGEGEISFQWGTADSAVGGRYVDSLEEGESFSLTYANRMRFTVDPDALLPRIFVSGTEFDRPKSYCPVEDARLGGFHLQPDYDAMCRRRTNVASTGLIGAHLEGLLSCASYGAIGDWEDDACVIIHTEDLGEDYPRFWVLVSFRR